ncbi:fructose-bisphosphate aldolase class II [Kineococcus radiotolerans]|uniref:Fructose-bisphosphate aldolase class II n=1 Tax=Kineococcus radiotolerans TaxID=131568 RepID=A0A7W4TR42_KINRA|nr:class II fructose-bisphosphate aldolase [Kineococcus radiotolerans]MBB2903563.1 fructose-bisphosphate aldolase class II [Kineococcus radiotolerans]
MSLVTPHHLLLNTPDAAGVAAFNVILTEHLEAFLAAAERSRTGLILQLSQNAVRYHGSLGPIASAVLHAARHADVPVAVQLDHADDVALIHEAADLGFTSIMYDGSRLDYEDNLQQTAQITAHLHRAGIWVEAELGEVGGKNGVHSATARTEPQQAADFATRTGVDGLAVAVGSSHAMREQTASIDLDLIASLGRAVDVPLVLHGSSGVDDDSIRAACAAGIRKVNFGTRFNVVMTHAIRETMLASPDVVDPRKYLAAARSAATDEATHLLHVVTGTTS